MGLAPYGNPIYAETIKTNLIDIKPDGTFRLNLKYFKYHRGLRMTSRRFDQLFNQPPRKSESDLTQFHMDLAASIQQVTEEIVLLLAKTLQKETGCDNLCLAGGVALNCVANGRLQREGPFQNIWIQPASGDAGSALGAALVAWHQHFQEPRIAEPSDSMQGTYLGPNFNNQTITSFLNSIQAPSEHLKIQPYLLNLPHCWIKAKWWAGSTDAWSLGHAPWGRAQFSGTLATARCKPQ